MSGSIIKIGHDYRRVLLLLLALVISISAFGDDLWRQVAKGRTAKTIILPGNWREMGLVWDSSGSSGAGVYGGAYPVNQGTADNYPLVSPRLAIFIFCPFDLNQVDADTLQVVKGIGPKLAMAIVEHRLTHGPFKAVEGVLAVKGIGPAKLATLRNYVALPPVLPQRPL